MNCPHKTLLIIALACVAFAAPAQAKKFKSVEEFDTEILREIEEMAFTLPRVFNCREILRAVDQHLEKPLNLVGQKTDERRKNYNYMYSVLGVMPKLYALAVNMNSTYFADVTSKCFDYYGYNMIGRYGYLDLMDNGQLKAEMEQTLFGQCKESLTYTTKMMRAMQKERSVCESEVENMQYDFFETPEGDMLRDAGIELSNCLQRQLKQNEEVRNWKEAAKEVEDYLAKIDIADLTRNLEEMKLEAAQLEEAQKKKKEQPWWWPFRQ